MRGLADRPVRLRTPQAHGQRSVDMRDPRVRRRLARVRIDIDSVRILGCTSSALPNHGRRVGLPEHRVRDFEQQRPRVHTRRHTSPRSPHWPGSAGVGRRRRHSPRTFYRPLLASSHRPTGDAPIPEHRRVTVPPSHARSNRFESCLGRGATPDFFS